MLIRPYRYSNCTEWGMAYRCKHDKHWTMQFVSDGCKDLTGFAPESFLNNRELAFNDVIKAEYQDLLRKKWERILKDRSPFEYEYEIITFNGESKWVLEMGEGVYDDKGNVKALEGIILDISDRKEMENNLRYNNEHDYRTGFYNQRYLENILKIDAMKESKKKVNWWSFVSLLPTS